MPAVPESDTDVINITVNEVNYLPVITSNGGGATAAISVHENTLDGHHGHRDRRQSG